MSASSKCASVASILLSVCACCMREDISCAAVSVGVDCESNECVGCERGKYEKHSDEVKGGEDVNDRESGEEEIEVESDTIVEALEHDCEDETSSSMVSIA